MHQIHPLSAHALAPKKSVLPKRSQWLLALALPTALFLTGCNSSQSSSDSDSDPVGYTPESMSLSSAVIFDAENRRLSNAEVGLLPATDAQSLSLGIQPRSTGEAPSPADFFVEDKLQTDEDGVFIADLSPGVWYVLTEKNNGSTITTITVQDENASGSTDMASALSCDETSCQDVSDSAIIGAISGVVFDSEGTLANANVSLSGGAATNGQFVSATTGPDGSFGLVYNLNRTDAILEALETAILRVTLDGYETATRTLSIDTGNTSGINVAMSALASETASNQKVLWEDQFDAQSLESWTISNSHDNAGWGLLESGHNILNTLVGGHVLLAPNDESEGALPDPHTGDYAFWYGNPQSGNFLGDEDANDSWSLDGGTSETPNSGTLTSSPIDLSTVSTDTDISLTFRTWWEIESVNPNENGFDLMSVQVSTDGVEFSTIARLNPLSDPQSNANREPIPFSNTGFNNAPRWNPQELIPLEGLAGEETVYLRFEFRTEDELFNGFRGWLIDNLQIRNEPGTFPIFEAWEDEYFAFCEDVAPLCDEDPDAAFEKYCEQYSCDWTDDMMDEEEYEVTSKTSLMTEPLLAPSGARFLANPQR